MQLISVEEYLMGRIKIEDLTNEQMVNLNTIVPRANDLLLKFTRYRKVNSGYRSPEDQARINPKATQSKHLICAAVDLEDRDRQLTHYCLSHLDVLKEIGLWMEDSIHTPTWVHVQCIPPKSGYRVFIP